MWRRFRRRTLAPRRPVLFPEQYGLAIATGVALVAGLALLVFMLVR